LDLPDAAFATGAEHVDYGGTITDMIVIGGRVRLVDYDPEDAVRLGLTALPNAAADGVGGLPISDAGGLDLDTKLANTNEVSVARMGALTDWINGGRLDLLLDAIPTTAMRGTDSAATASALATAQADLDIITGASGVNLLTATQASIDAIEVDTSTTLQADLDIITGATGVNLLTATQASIDAIEADTSTTLQGELDAIQAAVITNAAGVDIAADIIALKAETVLIVADTNELQTDLVNGGRLDLILDIIAADTTTDIPAQIAALNDFDPATDEVLANVVKLNSIAAGAIRLALAAGQMIPFTVDTAGLTPTTVKFEADDITEATANHYKARTILWITGVLAGQATDITAYALASGRGQFTVSALTEAPGNNDTGIII
ncbi:MAG: hypothetical protein O3B04_10395, partial [Chloroflexi bacterium]|nr:hypothetical protein [Chloroflexota bacterium]